ncbi:MAG: dynamin family protein [Lachnospiraceae bacterium]|nr:dynamin family protein [Lachnospiraceae bacterium]
MISTKSFKEVMEKIHQKVSEEKELLVKNGVSVKGTSENEDIDVLLRRTKDTSFKVLVMGRFSSGKSAFINVLLGEKLLPEGAMPMTALITEIYYGEEKKVIMFPKEGQWPDGDEPFEIEPKLSEIKKFSTINNKSGMNKKEANRVDSCFEKMIVYWPLDILKEGVSIVDSPGTDDPYSNDYIVEEYVPKADAILYCINGTNAYCAGDKRTLERMNSIGFDNPIIVTSYFDVVTDGMEPDEIQDFIDTSYQSFYSNHTEKKYCHYVNSKLGMQGKIENKQSDLVDSGYFELEKVLSQFLTENKGKAKIAGVTAAVRQFNEGQKKRLNGVISNLDRPLEDFNKRVEEAKARLEQAELQGELLIREFKIGLKEPKEKVANELMPQLYQDLYDNINLDDFEPDTNFTMWHPKESSAQIADECSKELEIRNKQYVSDWNKRVLQPMVTESFKEIVSKMQNQFDAFESDIEEANLTLETGGVHVDTEVKTGTRVAMVAYALVTGDWLTALMGGVFGMAAFGRTMACEFAAGLVVGIIALFTPVGLATIVIAAIGGLIGGLAWNASKAAQSVKNNAVKAMRESLSENKEKIIVEATKKCTEIFDKQVETLKQAIDDDIEEVRENIEIIKEERKTNEAKINNRKEELSGLEKFIDSVDEEMVRIRKELDIRQD